MNDQINKQTTKAMISLEIDDLFPFLKVMLEKFTAKGKGFGINTAKGNEMQMDFMAQITEDKVVAIFSKFTKTKIKDIKDPEYLSQIKKELGNYKDSDIDKMIIQEKVPIKVFELALDDIYDIDMDNVNTDDFKKLVGNLLINHLYSLEREFIDLTKAN